ncbi:hypothetical protein J4760_04290 [Salinicoccus sp. ID82-1]|uniref:Uncharacterized protein n=1 Tax=Salinicoccus cyprini TaxID=2493691 RepID=A0A558AZD8_9STAP|nr:MULTISPECIES: hypothetical protein [Salinicoccus]MCG1009270.1 hypothetical protein [Salinicoccus sp. ID82-1]TVT29648.1 hypothetical protein FO441_05040 [Salinicoccus cyprini]
MKSPVKVYLATYFTILSILYLSIRYTTFEMRPAIFIVASILLIGSTAAVMRSRDGRGMMAWTILCLTAVMLLTFLIK